MNSPADISLRVLVLTPTGNDAVNTAMVLERGGLQAKICRNLKDVCGGFREGAGAILISEEALAFEEISCLLEDLSNQPPWSDIPVLLVTGTGETSLTSQRRLNLFPPGSNITLLERPLRPITLISSLEVALRSRRRQYELREFLAEQEETKARLELALEGGQLGLWDWDLVTQKIIHSRKHDQIFGHMDGLTEWSYEQFLEHVVPAERAAIEAIFRQALTEREPLFFECKIRRADGAEAWIWARGRMLFDKEGNPARLIGVVTDITERKKRELERERFFEVGADLLAIGNFNGYLEWVSPAWERTLGWTAEELKAQPWIHFVHPEDVALTVASGEKVSRGEDVYQFENRYRHKDGSYRWFNWKVKSFSAEGRFYGGATDITERKRIENELRNAREHLEKTVQQRTAELQTKVGELEAFSYSVSHDLRAPLRAMQGFSRFLLEDYADQLDPTGREYIQRIVTAAERLDRLVSDILTYSRVARADIQNHPIDLEKLIHDIAQSYPGFHEPHATIEIKGPLPRVMGHEGSLTQCISNILGNAVKFVAPGVKPRVRIWSEPSDGKVCVYFQDNGIGIPPEHQERIFRIFEKTAQNNVYEGTGIGLAIVRKAVERMGGAAGVESAPDQGSRFWIQLPKAP